jgi:hypothetical protein
MERELIQKGQVLRGFTVLSVCGAIVLQFQTSSLSEGAFSRISRKQQSERASHFYKIARIFSSADTRGFTIAVVTVDADRFNSADMKVLARQLNREFDKVSRVKAGLLDDENAARLFLSGGLEMPEFERAQRGLYYLDRTKAQEYIRFSPKRSRPKRQVRIRLKCD